MKPRIVCIAVLLMAVVPAGFAAETGHKELKVVKEQIARELLSPEYSRRSAEALAESASGFMKALRDDGTWPDIYYKCQRRSSWRPPAHLRKTFTMAQAYRWPKGPLAGNGALKGAVLKALDHWLAEDYRCPNWWHNEIGTPMHLGRILVLMEPSLNPKQLRSGIKIMRRSKVGRTGQNMVWQAGNQVVWGCLANDPKAVDTACRSISGTIKISGQEGIKPDWSFWQHGNCLYSGGYGMAFSDDVPYYARLVRGTKFAFPKSRVRVLSSYLLDGQQWMVRGPQMDYGTVGRNISRPNAGGIARLVKACRRMMDADPSRRTEYTAFLDRLQTDPLKARHPLHGNRHFWHSDFMTHHRKGWYASARMYSKRLVNTDVPCNDEGLLSHHIADGANFIMKRGDEYQNIFPSWNWQRVPGITVAYRGGTPKGSVRVSGSQRFVGGVSDGEYGLAAMSLARDDLTARKSWFFFDREFVCLGAGISCKSDLPVLTSMNQCHLKGAVLNKGQTLEKGTHKLQGPTWIHHDDVGYILAARKGFIVKNDAQTGSWSRIRKVSSKDPVTQDVFSLWLDHGKKPRRGTYAYVVAPGIAAKDMNAYVRDTGITVLKNRASLQAVMHRKLGIVGAVFSSPGELKTEDGLSISVDNPCLVLVRLRPTLKVSASNPVNQGLKLRVTIGQRGSAPKTFAFQLPGDWKEAGRSVTLPR